MKPAVMSLGLGREDRLQASFSEQVPGRVYSVDLRADGITGAALQILTPDMGYAQSLSALINCADQGNRFFTANEIRALEDLPSSSLAPPRIENGDDALAALTDLFKVAVDNEKMGRYGRIFERARLAIDALRVVLS